MSAADDRSASGATLESADLSDWFNPFLRHFAVEADRTGGTVRIVRGASSIVALVVTDTADRTGTVFSRDPAVAREVVESRNGVGMFADRPVFAAAERYDIFRWSRGDVAAPHRFAHSIRPLLPDDLTAAGAILREVYGPSGGRWLESGVPAGEVGFLAEIQGRLAGVAWLTLVGAHGRLHSLAVRAPYRRLGVGTDLVAARRLWAESMGAVDVVSEVSERNAASRTCSVRAGLRPVGAIYFHPPVPAPGVSSGSPRSTGTS